MNDENVFQNGTADNSASGITVRTPFGSRVTDGEVIAAVSAAIAAYEEETTFDGFTYRKLNRTAGARTAWNLAGNRETIESRLV
jgi:hypothetical protein